MKKIIMIKKVRPWVKASTGLFLGFAAFSLIRTFLFKPKPHIVQFDLKKIEAMRDGKIEE